MAQVTKKFSAVIPPNFDEFSMVMAITSLGVAMDVKLPEKEGDQPAELTLEGDESSVDLAVQMIRHMGINLEQSEA